MVAETEAPTSGPTPNADETTSSPHHHQPTDYQLAVVPLATGDTSLPTDFQNEPALLAPPNDTVEPFISLSKMSPSFRAVSSDLSCVEEHDYDIEKAQTTPLQIHNPDGVESSEDSFFSSAISRVPLSSDTNPQPNDVEATAIEIGGLQSAVIKLHIPVAEVEVPTSAATPDADETTSSPHQPTTDQLAVVPLPTGDTPLPTDFQNEPGLIAPPHGTVGPFSSLSKMPMSCGGVSSDPSGVEKHNYDLEKAQTTPLQIHNPDVGVESSDDTFHGSAISRIPLSSDPNPQTNGMEDAALEIGGLQSAVVKLQVQNGPSLPTPDNSSELFSIPPEACLSGGALSSEPNYAEKHENHTQRTQATPVDIVFPDGSEPRIGCKEGDLLPGLSDAVVTMVTEGSASSGPPAPASEATLSSFSTPCQPWLQAPIPHTGGAQLSNDETQTTSVEPSSSTDLIEPARRLTSLPGDIQPSSHSDSAPASEVTLPSFSMPRQPCFPQAPMSHTGGTQLRSDEIQTTLVQPSSSMDLNEPAKRLPSLSCDSTPASEVTLSSFSMPHRPTFLQAPIRHTGGTQLRYDEIQTTLVEPTSSIDLIEPARRRPSLPHDIQPLSHSNSAPAGEALDAVEESQRPLYSEDHIRLQDYDPFDGSFPTATVNRGRYTGPNAMPVQYSPYESSQIRRSPVQDYYPNESNYLLPHYRQGARDQGQRESSSASELTYKHWSYGDQYQGQEYDVSRPYGVSNQRQMYCPVNDVPDGRPRSHGGRHQGPDYHDSNNDNFDDMSRPFEVRYEEQVHHLGNAESDDMPQSHARQSRRHDYWHGMNVLNDMHRQPHRDRYQQQSYCLDERYSGEAPQPYGSHYRRREDWPEEKKNPVMPQPPCRGHHQRQIDWLGNNIVDGVPPQHTSRYQGRESWSSNDGFAGVQRTGRGPANFPGNDDFADMPRTEREPAKFPGNDDFADAQRTERGPANFLSNDSIHMMASQRKDHYQRPEFAEFKSHEAFPTNHELEHMHPRTQGGDFKGVLYQTTADPDFQKEPHRIRKSCYRDYSFNHELQSQRDQCYDATGSTSKDENTPQLTGQNCAKEEKSSSQAGDGVGCESGTLVCDNIVSGPNSSNVVIGERNRAGGRTGGRITGNLILR